MSVRSAIWNFRVPAGPETVSMRFPGSTDSIVPSRVDLLDTPGDWPIGMYISVASCPKASETPASATTTITRASQYFNMAVPSRSKAIDELCTRVALSFDSLLDQARPLEEAASRLVCQLLGLLQMGHRLRVQPPGLQHPDAVLRLDHGLPEQLFGLLARREALLGAGLQDLDALPDALHGVEDPQKGGHRHHLRCVELDPDLLRVARGQDLPCRRLVEAVAVVERDRSFDGFNRIVVEERAGAGGFHQRWSVERVVAWPAEPVVQRDLFAGQLGRLVGQICDAGIEVGIAAVAAAEIRGRPGVRVVQIALAQPIIEEDLLPALRDGAFERE